jgi:serine/threonine protein kinase
MSSQIPAPWEGGWVAMPTCWIESGHTMQTGKYELISKLAVGGMAEVFLARAAGPRGFEKTLVLKRILPHLAEEPGFVEMFLREAKLVAQLNHPHIVQIFDFGEDHGSYFLAMEYIDGLNLRALLKKAQAAHRPLPPALCARLIASACEGLAFAHDFQDPATGKPLGLIHRDISTDNILVSRQGAVKVVDFGIAKTADSAQKTQTGVIKGKLAYMPPEQIRGEPLDRRADVYALGVVLFELLTGHRPFESPTDVGLMQAILFEPLPSATEYRPDVPQALQRILRRALAKEREKRYSSCRDFQFELEDFIVSSAKTLGAYQLSQWMAPLLSAAVPPALSPSDTGERPALSEASRQLSGTLPVHTPEKGLPAGASPSPRLPPSMKRLPWLAGAALLMTGGGYVAGSRSAAPAVALRAPVAPAQELSFPEKPLPVTPARALEPSKQLQLEPEAVPAPPPAPSTPLPSVQQPSGPSKARVRRADAPARTGKLLLIVRAWADIWVDGKQKGRVPPLNELELPVGRHELRLVNPSLKPYRAVVTISAGETLEHRVIVQDSGFLYAGRSEPESP